jgi:hypothetical protein
VLLDEALDVISRDAPAQPGTGNLVQIDLMITGQFANEG